ncbi:MAG: hypothetical protein CMJ24_12080 [Phycisphaerae bacterium]|nr:hypothetical protein [Phycisphaerae bacterium]
MSRCLPGIDPPTHANLRSVYTGRVGIIPPVRFAVIDVGSNSVRLEIACGAEGVLKSVYGDRVVTRLAGADGDLAPDSIDATVDAIRRMLLTVKKHDVRSLRIVATAAVRAASNAHELVDRVLAATGCGIEVLSERVEAEAVLRSVMHGPGSEAAEVVAIDVGGGSSEIITARDGKVVHVASMPLGAVNLAVRYEQADVIDATTHAAMRMEIRTSLARWIPDAPAPGLRGFAAGGTFTTIAGVLGHPHGAMEGAVVTRQQVHSISARLSSLDADGRSDLRGVGRERSGIIVAGVTLADMIMSALELDLVHIHEGGVGRGILLEMAALG